MIETFRESDSGQQLGGARVRFALAAALDELRHRDVLDRREFRQQLMELVDEAHGRAADTRAVVVLHPRAVTAPDDDLSAVGRFEETRGVQQR